MIICSFDVINIVVFFYKFDQTKKILIGPSSACATASRLVHIHACLGPARPSSASRTTHSSTSAPRVANMKDVCATLGQPARRLGDQSKTWWTPAGAAPNRNQAKWAGARDAGNMSTAQRVWAWSWAGGVVGHSRWAKERARRMAGQRERYACERKRNRGRFV
jgi:hypothetical protein